MTIPRRLTKEDLPSFKCAPDREVEIPAEHGDRPAHAVKQHQAFAAVVGADVIPRSEGEHPSYADILGVGMEDHAPKGEMESSVAEIGLPKGAVDEVRPFDPAVEMANPNKPLPVFAENAEGRTVGDVCTARIVGFWNSSRLRLSLEIVNRLKQVFTQAEFEADAIKVIKGEVYVRLKRVDLLDSKAGH